MKQHHNLIQGSQEWQDFRASHFGASEAAAMLGISPYQSRQELLRNKALGAESVVSPALQDVFDRGHKTEIGGRAMAEELINEDLFPVVISDGRLSVSCDGLVMDESLCFEHKQWNDGLAESLRNGVLPEHHQPQVQQAMHVSGADRCLFMCSDGTPGRCVTLYVERDQKWIDKIVRGWSVFAEDLANYKHVEVIEAPAVAPIDSLPVLSVELVGEVRASNIVQWSGAVRARIAAINEDLRTDEDFAIAKKTVAFLEDGEKQLAKAKDAALAQTVSIADLYSTIDGLREEMRAKRLSLDKLVKAKEVSIRADIRREGMDELTAHMAALNHRLGPGMMPAVPANFEAVMKSKRTLQSLRDAVAGEVARVKIEASAIADRIALNLQHYGEVASGYEFLFRDLHTVAQQPAEAFAAIVANRIREHKDAEEKRLAAERERIAAEERAKLEREQKAHREKEERDAREKAAAEQRLRDEDARQKRQESAVDQVAITLNHSIAAGAPVSAPTPSPAVSVRQQSHPSHAGITGTARLRDLIDDQLQRMTEPQLQEVLDAIMQIRARKAA